MPCDMDARAVNLHRSVARPVQRLEGLQALQQVEHVDGVEHRAEIAGIVPGLEETEAPGRNPVHCAVAAQRWRDDQESGCGEGVDIASLH